MVCQACHAEVEAGLKFCVECGAPLTLRCASCGTPHPPNRRFCGECGAALEDRPTHAESLGPAEIRTGAASAEMRMASVLFVDLVGFTSLSESREAEDVRELLGRYFDSSRTIVERHGGGVQKFIGDAVMAVWGAPSAREDDAERAVRAALELVDAVGVFGEEVGAPNLRARAGVVTGQVAALDNPEEGLVVGDRVNTASRIQSTAAPGAVLVDEVTRQLTAASIAYEDAGEHMVKGKAEPLRLWRAVRVVAGVGGSDREQGLEAPFVGRDPDLRLLKDLFHGALERGTARLVAVFGEAGVGKSRLRREFSNYTDGLSQTVLWHMGRCLSYGDGVAYWALAEMVRQRLGIPEEAGTEEAASKLAAGLERWVPDVGDRSFISPRLGALLGTVEPGLHREELFAGWRLFFERLAEIDPVVLVFEDLQWADAGLIEFIEQLLDWSANSPIFIVTLARPELRAGREGWPAGHRGATVIQLEPLDDHAMNELLRDVVDGLPEQAAERIVGQAQGIPLYALETLRGLLDRGVLAQRDGRLVLDGELGQLDVPASLSSLIAARLDALEPEERTLVKSMSVFGGAFPRATAVALGEVREELIDEVLASLVRKQVFVIRADPLSPDRGQYAFAQGLLRTVAYEMLSRHERKPRHVIAAEHLRRVFPNDGEDVAEVIASHYLDAYRAAHDDPDAEGLRVQTLAALRRAAQRAATVGAPESAERSYRTAVELASDEAERAELIQGAAELAQQAGRSETALELFEAAAAAHTTAGRDRDAARVAGGIGLALTRLGRNSEAAERITKALEVLGPERPDEEVGVLNAALGRALVFCGDYEGAAPALDSALEIAQALKLPAVLSDSLISQSISCLQLGRAEESRVLSAGAIEIATRHGLSEELSRAVANMANLAMQWDLPDAAEQCESALSLARRRGNRFGESLTAGNLMAVQLFAGHWRELERLATELLRDNEERPGYEFVHLALAAFNPLRGRTDLARVNLERLSSWLRSDDTEFRANRASAEVCVLLAEGMAGEALESGKRMLEEVIDELGASNGTVRLGWPDALAAALALGRVDDARGLVALLERRPPGHIPPYLDAQLIRGRALIDAAEGEHDTVEADLSYALTAFGELGYPYWLATTQTDLAAWLIGQGRGSDAAPLLEHAISTLQSLGAGPALARARGLRDSMVGARPEALT